MVKSVINSFIRVCWALHVSAALQYGILDTAWEHLVGDFKARKADSLHWQVAGKKKKNTQNSSAMAQSGKRWKPVLRHRNMFTSTARYWPFHKHLCDVKGTSDHPALCAGVWPPSCSGLLVLVWSTFHCVMNLKVLSGKKPSACWSRKVRASHSGMQTVIFTTSLSLKTHLQPHDLPTYLSYNSRCSLCTSRAALSLALNFKELRHKRDKSWERI